MNIRIENFVNENDKLLLKKHIYIPNNNLLLDICGVTFKNIILDYDIYLNNEKQLKNESNYITYKFSETINNSYLMINNFLIQIFYLLNKKYSVECNLMPEDINDNLNTIFGTYQPGKGKGKNNQKNNNTNLINEIEKYLNINLTDEKKDIKYIELLCRNYFSHGWHLLLLNMYSFNMSRNRDFFLTYNENFVDEDSVFFLKTDNFNTNKELKLLRDELLNLKTAFNETDDLTYFLQDNNYQNNMYLSKNEFMINTACSRIFLKKNFFNRWKTINIESINQVYIKLFEVSNNKEKVINIELILQLMSNIIKKIEIGFNKHNISYKD